MKWPGAECSVTEFVERGAVVASAPMGRVSWLWMALLVSGEASAQSLTLRWTAPSGCPDQAAVLDAVRAAGAPERPRQALVVDGVVTHPGRWRAVLTTRHGDRPGTRTLESRSCPRLVQGVAMVIALAMEEAPADEPSATTTITPRTAPPVLFVDDDELPPILRPRPRLPPPPRARRVRMGVSLHARGDLGTLPSFAPALGLGLSVWGQTLGAMAEVTGLVTQGVDGPRPGTAMRLGAWRGALLGCALGGRRVRVGACTGVEVNRMEGRGEGFQRNADDVSWMFGVPLRARVGVELGGRVEVLGEAEAMVPIERVRYAVEGVGELHAVWPVTVRAGLSAIWRWP